MAPLYQKRAEGSSRSAVGAVWIRLVLLLVAVGASLTTAAGVAQSALPRLDDRLPPSVDRLLDAFAARVTGDDAMALVVFMDQFWRLAGNPGFTASQERIREGLRKAGFTAPGVARSTAGPDARVWDEEFRAATPGWEYSAGTLSLVLPAGDEVLLSRETHRVALCINSFSTRQGGVTLRVVDVGDGTRDADYAGKEIAGALVLGDGDVGRLWVEAVRERGAAGVVSTEVAPYIVRPAPGIPPDELLDVLQWDEIPYDPSRRSFGFKATRRAAQRLRRALGDGPVRVKVDIDTAFHFKPNRNLVAEIRGSTRPDERIVLVAHVQEPGANDNASGCGTLLEIAVALRDAIARGAVPAPARTLTFLWVDEITGSREWLASHEGEARYMFSLDMTGEDAARTGASFLVEKQADPSAVWPRPSDPHSEWGRTTVNASSLHGSLLTDLHLAVSQRWGRAHSWPIATTPFSAGSDHEVFHSAGVPSLLLWHFTDRYYHTNLDRPDKVNPREMRNVGVTVGSAALFLATAVRQDAIDVAGLVSHAASWRLDLEERQLREESGAGAGAEDTQRIFAAWKQWYVEALASVLDLPVDGPDDRLRAQVDRMADAVRNRTLGPL